ncbi:Alpha-acetolactate decarboxylase [Apiospora arundinis]|uniref:Alpha-acetolactate decarboxylase n=1 Tax=Apiospora arundinis TaxID=335852 RepID=A0ABR2HJR5_9PEZI
MSSNKLFQYSIVSALMDGVASTGMPIAMLLAHGNHGLGTFRHIAGEMIILDGEVFQMKSDGSISKISATAMDIISPFAMITNFEPSDRIVAFLQSKAALFDLLTELLPMSRNHYVGIRVEGSFSSITVRTVGGQKNAHEGLAELGKHQVSHTLRSEAEEIVQGTIIGFRSPAYMQGVSVAGDHLHFVTADRTKGGHVLAFVTLDKVEVSAAAISTVHIELPTHDVEFNEATLKGEHEAIEAVEG